MNGPFKILYNAVSVSLTSRIFASKVKDVRASCYYHVSDWYNSYVINQNVLLDEEKKQTYSLIKDLDGKLNYAKNITTSNLSILDFYKKSVYDFLADQYAIALQEIDVSNMEFYIEITNPDVKISNSVQVTQDSTLSQNVSEIPTSYTLFKVDPTALEAPLYAYTNAPSAEFKIPGGFGAYVLRDRVYKSSNSLQDNLNSKISSRNIYQSYPFKFTIFNSYVQSSESPTTFSAQWSTEIEATYEATLSRQEFYKIDRKQTGTEATDPVWSETLTASEEADPAQTEAYAVADDRLNGQYRATNSIASRNNYLFTRDVTHGNTYKNYKVGQTGMLPAYIAFIQITLREAKISNSSLLDCPLNRVYDTQTAAAVTKFQQVYKARIKDGIVDTETKSLFTREVWKKMFQTDNARYQEVYNRVSSGNNSDAAVFIRNAATVAEIWELKNTDLDFQKISYTGTEGALEVSDVIYIAVPPKYRNKNNMRNVRIKSIGILPGSFQAAPSYKGISIEEVKGYAFDLDTQTANYSKSQTFGSTLPISTNGRVISIDKPLEECGVISIKIKGGKLGGSFGPYAEGYAIRHIVFNISYEAMIQGPGSVPVYSEEKTGYNLVTTTKPVTIKYKISGKVENVSPNKAEVIDLSGLKSVKFTTEPLSITYPTFTGSSTIDLTTTKIDFSSKEYKPPFSPYTQSLAGATPNYKDESIKIDLTSSKSISINASSLNVSNVLSGTKNPVNQSSVSATILDKKLFFQTSSLNYQNSNIIKSSDLNIENYWLLKQDGSLIQKAKNSVSVLDGLLLLCQPSNDPEKIGKPYGIQLQNFISSNSANSELNVDYGAFILQNEAPNNGGFLYGFYDRLRKEFIGTTLYYNDLINRGADNVYIAVLALDADGNIGGSDFIGSKTFGTIPPPFAPVKIACPVYHATYIPSSRISLSSIPPNLSKLDAWPLYITSGSFVREIYVDPNYGWTGWLQKYSGKTIRATYSTLDMQDVLWSQILGQPYVDVLNEYPVFLSSRKIQLSQVPIASFVEPSENALGVLKQYLFIETRNSIDDEWDQLDFNYIRNVNCSTGIIDVIKDLPQDPDLLRVSYAVKASGIPIKHVNGSPVPINPFLNQEEVEPEKPLYIYIKPSKVEVKNYTSPQTYTWDHVSDYSFNGVVHFTYDNSIFNQYESSSFDITAVQIGLIHVLKNRPASGIDIVDLRVKGGGIKSTFDKSNNIESYGALDIEKVFKQTKEAISFWDVYPPEQQAYPNGGFIIIKMPKTVLDNFINKEEVYSIIRKNITAGVVFKIQDMEGNDWGVV